MCKDNENVSFVSATFPGDVSGTFPGTPRAAKAFPERFGSLVAHGVPGCVPETSPGNVAETCRKRGDLFSDVI
jgi:hypothetical protein